MNREESDDFFWSMRAKSGRFGGARTFVFLVDPFPVPLAVENASSVLNYVLIGNLVIQRRRIPLVKGQTVGFREAFKGQCFSCGRN
jgi:hypothetical protein